MDLDRLPAGAEHALNESTLSCLIGHALAFRRLQQTAGMLFTGPAPSTDKVLAMAVRRGDHALVNLMRVCTPLLRAVMDLCREAEAAFVKKQFAREQAVDIAAQQIDAVKDVNGVYSGGRLLVKTKEPDALLAAATLRRHTVYWNPPRAESAAEFIGLLSADITKNAQFADALEALLGMSPDVLEAEIRRRTLANAE